MSSASVMRASAWVRATSAPAWARLRSRLPHSGSSCSTVKNILFWRGPRVRSISSEVMRSVGSASEPAISTRACAASVSSARAASSGLSRRAIASTSSSVAPGATKETGASAAAGPESSMIASSRSIHAARGAGGERESWRSMLFRRVEGDAAAHRAGFALHLGAEIERPLAGHARLDLKAIKPGFVRGQGTHLARHFGHAAWTHIALALEQHGAGDRLVVRYMHKANRDGGFARTGWLGLDQLETVVVRGSQPVSRDECRGGEDRGAEG